jgi:hypothetical protein
MHSTCSVSVEELTIVGHKVKRINIWLYVLEIKMLKIPILYRKSHGDAVFSPLYNHGWSVVTYQKEKQFELTKGSS